MTIAPNRQRNLLKVYIVCGCAALFASPSVLASGLSIHYSNQGHGVGSGQHQSRGYGSNPGHYQRYGAVGNVTIRRNSHHHNSTNSRNPHYRNHHDSYSHYRSYTSPRTQFYIQQYAQPYLNSRFPNSYRSYGYDQQRQARQYVTGYSQSGDAWEALVQGRIRIALNQFSREAQSYPKAGVPKIGYALSAAASGKLDQGVIAMRRAFRIDPYSLRHYQLDQRLLPMLDDLIGRYQYSLKHRGRHKDEAFMLAALSYLNSDYETAHHALERAERDGDHSHSLRNLRDILEET